MSNPQPPVDIVAMRRRALETWDTCTQLALKYLADADKLGTPGNPFDEELYRNYLRIAEVCAQLALACQKVPGSQF